MKKIRVIVITLIAFFVSTSWVNALCDATESNRLNGLAVNVKHSYEIVDLEVPLPDDYNLPDGMSDEDLENYVNKESYYRIYLSNITEDLYVVVTNTNTNEKKTFRYSDTENGSVSFDERVGTEIINYTFEVYASEKNDCVGRKLHTMYLTTPMYNVYSESANCTGISEFYLCHEYLSVDVKFDKFDSLTEQYREGKIREDGSIKEDEKTEKGFFGFIKEHKGIVIGATFLIVVAGGCITIVIVKKQRSRIV